jgi:pimeloyl-ACP methyl ester carboxylesterase
MQRVEFRRVSMHGHDVAFRSGGTGPVILLVHGMAGSSSTWRHVMPALAEHFTVVAPDVPGHGASAKPRGDYSLGALAAVCAICSPCWDTSGRRWSAGRWRAVSPCSSPTSSPSAANGSCWCRAVASAKT